MCEIKCVYEKIVSVNRQRERERDREIVFCMGVRVLVGKCMWVSGCV